MSIDPDPATDGEDTEPPLPAAPTPPPPDTGPVDTPPDAPPAPPQPIVFEPFTWYQVTSTCTTPACPNLNTTTTEPMVYSNAGTVIMVCGLCNQRRTILAATKLDPQPEMS